jgi:hypothetical protein
MGLGLTNTPVTNTTTGAVAAKRAGMASGVDMSARMISLAVNIALMGFILLEGVRASLKAALPGDIDAASLRQLAQQIASGAAIPPDRGVSAAIVHDALTSGFGWIMLYGGISVWILAGVSYFVFGRKAATKSPSCPAEPVAP